MIHLALIDAGGHFPFFMVKVNEISYFRATRNNLDFILDTECRIIDSMHELIVATDPKKDF